MAIYRKVAAGGNRIEVVLEVWRLKLSQNLQILGAALMELELPVGGRALDLVERDMVPHHSIETRSSRMIHTTLSPSFASQHTCST